MFLEILIFIGFAVAAGYFLYTLVKILRLKRRMEASQAWPRTAGRVTDARVRGEIAGKGGRHYYTEVAYTYNVFGSEYTGKFREDTFFGFKRAAEDNASAYPAGMPIQVRYNPDRPHEAVTEYDRVSRYELFQVIMFLVTVVVIGIYLLYMGV